MLRERLGKELLYFDGGMGTLLQERGLQRENSRRHGICCTQKKSVRSTENILKLEVTLY